MLIKLFQISICLILLTPALVVEAQRKERVALPEQINSPFTEIRPFITGDGRTLYFGRREHPSNLKGDKDLQDVYVVRREGNEWGTPVNLGGPVNNRFSNSLFTVSPEGDELLMLNTYKKIGGPLARFKKQGEGWGNPESVTIEDFHNYSEYLDFYQSYTENVLLLAVEREDSRGEQDIYVSFLQDDGSYTKPKNLGPGVNTKKSDFAPFLAPDGRTLFFASYGLVGRGGADIYYVQRLDETWTKWSSPVNLGEPINSSGEETFFSVTDDAHDIYYVSYRHGSENRDIYKSPLLPKIDLLPPMPSHRPALTLHRSIKTVNTAAVPQTAALSESITEQEDEEEDTLAADEAAIADRAADQRDIQTSESTTTAQEQKGAPGQTTFAGTTATKKEGSAGGLANLGLNVKEVPSDIPAKKQYSILRNIYYDFNQTTLKENAYTSVLQKVITFMNENPDAMLKIVGHADEKGTKGENLKVSQRRAQLLKKYLVEKGIASERILVHYRGEEEPLASNDDDRDGRELNRRSEFIVLMPANP